MQLSGRYRSPEVEDELQRVVDAAELVERQVSDLLAQHPVPPGDLVQRPQSHSRSWTSSIVTSSSSARCRPPCNTPLVRVRALLVGTVALVAVESAPAAIAPVFDRATARIGESVAAFQPGSFQPGCGGIRRSGIRLYLITVRQAYALAFPTSDAALPNPPPRSLLRRPLGELRCARGGVLRLRFRIPAVAPGRYTTLVHCKPCGNTWFPGGFLGKNGVLRVRR